MGGKNIHFKQVHDAYSAKWGYMLLQHSAPAPYPLSPGKGEKLWHPLGLFHFQPCLMSLPTVCKAQGQILWDTKTSQLCSPEPSHSLDSHPPQLAYEEIALVEINTQCCNTELGQEKFQFAPSSPHQDYSNLCWCNMKIWTKGNGEANPQWPLQPVGSFINIQNTYGKPWLQPGHVCKYIFIRRHLGIVISKHIFQTLDLTSSFKGFWTKFHCILWSKSMIE